MVEAQGDPYFLTFPMKEELMSKKTPQSETPVKSSLDLPEVLPVRNILKMMNLQIMQREQLVSSC